MYTSVEFAWYITYISIKVLITFKKEWANILVQLWNTGNIGICPKTVQLCVLGTKSLQTTKFTDFSIKYIKYKTHSFV